MVRLASSFLLATLAATAYAASSPPKCSTDSHCPKEYPCCSREFRASSLPHAAC